MADHCFCKLPHSLKEVKGEHHDRSCDRYVLKLGSGTRIVRLDEQGQSVIEPDEWDEVPPHMNRDGTEY